MQAQPGSHFFSESVPLVACPLLEVRPLFEPESPYLAADAQSPAELQHETGVLAGFLSAQAVIYVQDYRLAAQLDERPQQRHRVRPARDQRQRPGEVHAVTLRRTPHGIHEIFTFHANSLKKWRTSSGAASGHNLIGPSIPVSRRG